MGSSSQTDAHVESHSILTEWVPPTMALLLLLQLWATTTYSLHIYYSWHAYSLSGSTFIHISCQQPTEAKWYHEYVPRKTTRPQKWHHRAWSWGPPTPPNWPKQAAQTTLNGYSTESLPSAVASIFLLCGWDSTDLATAKFLKKDAGSYVGWLTSDLLGARIPYNSLRQWEGDGLMGCEHDYPARATGNENDTP